MWGFRTSTTQSPSLATLTPPTSQTRNFVSIFRLQKDSSRGRLMGVGVVPFCLRQHLTPSPLLFPFPLHWIKQTLREKYTEDTPPTPMHLPTGPALVDANWRFEGLWSVLSAPYGWTEAPMSALSWAELNWTCCLFSMIIPMNEEKKRINLTPAVRYKLPFLTETTNHIGGQFWHPSEFSADHRGLKWRGSQAASSDWLRPFLIDDVIVNELAASIHWLRDVSEPHPLWFPVQSRGAANLHFVLTLIKP